MIKIKRNEELTFENWVTIEGKPVRVRDLPEKMQIALGNRVRREPLKVIGKAFGVEFVEIKRTNTTEVQA